MRQTRPKWGGAPCSPPSVPSSHPWRGAECRFQEPGGREGAKRSLGGGLRGFGVPGIRQRVQASRMARGGQLLSVQGLKARPEEGWRPSCSLSLPEPGTHSGPSSFPGDSTAPWGLSALALSCPLAYSLSASAHRRFAHSSFWRPGLGESTLGTCASRCGRELGGLSPREDGAGGGQAGLPDSLLPGFLGMRGVGVPLWASPLALGRPLVALCCSLPPSCPWRLSSLQPGG